MLQAAVRQVQIEEAEALEPLDHARGQPLAVLDVVQPGFELTRHEALDVAGEDLAIIAGHGAHAWARARRGPPWKVGASRRARSPSCRARCGSAGSCPRRSAG